MGDTSSIFQKNWSAFIALKRSLNERLVSNGQISQISRFKEKESSDGIRKANIKIMPAIFREKSVWYVRAHPPPQEVQTSFSPFAIPCRRQRWWWWCLTGLRWCSGEMMMMSQRIAMVFRWDPTRIFTSARETRNSCPSRLKMSSFHRQPYVGHAGPFPFEIHMKRQRQGQRQIQRQIQR